jgi:hypothetical protein
MWQAKKLVCDGDGVIGFGCDDSGGLEWQR